MNTLYEGAFAKLNLTLDVLGKRPDGYHDIKSVMQTVSIRDDIELDVGTGKPWRLHCDKEGIPTGEENLAWKAAKIYCDAMGKDPGGLEIRITKRIPMQAGMGGGSADAAAVLRALNRYYGDPLSVLALAELGAQVGSDVPFCVRGGTVLAEGRGERLHDLPSLPDCWLTLCKPAFGLSTPALFGRVRTAELKRRPDHGAMEQALCTGELTAVARQLANVFEEVLTAEESREIRTIEETLLPHGALGAVMTGSGPAVFGLFSEQTRAEEAAAALQRPDRQVFTVRPV